MSREPRLSCRTVGQHHVPPRDRNPEPLRVNQSRLSARYTVMARPRRSLFSRADRGENRVGEDCRERCRMIGRNQVSAAHVLYCGRTVAVSGPGSPTFPGFPAFLRYVVRRGVLPVRHPGQEVYERTGSAPPPGLASEVLLSDRVVQTPQDASDQAGRHLLLTPLAHAPESAPMILICHGPPLPCRDRHYTSIGHRAYQWFAFGVIVSPLMSAPRLP